MDLSTLMDHARQSLTTNRCPRFHGIPHPEFLIGRSCRGHAVEQDPKRSARAPTIPADALIGPEGQDGMSCPDSMRLTGFSVCERLYDRPSRKEKTAKLPGIEEFKLIDDGELPTDVWRPVRIDSNDFA